MRDIFIQGLSTVIALRVIADKIPNPVTSAVLHPGIHFYISHLILYQNCLQRILHSISMNLLFSVFDVA